MHIPNHIISIDFNSTDLSGTRNPRAQFWDFLSSGGGAILGTPKGVPNFGFLLDFN